MMMELSPSTLSMTEDTDDTAAQELERVFEAYGDAIFRYLYIQCRDRDLGKDLTQETFLKYWQLLKRGDIIEHERALLYRIAGNLFIDHIRKKKSVSLDQLLVQGVEPGIDPLHETQNRMEVSRALSMLGKLPEQYRQVLILRYVDNLEPAEIAHITKETSNVISVRIHRGLRQLKSFLDHA